MKAKFIYQILLLTISINTYSATYANKCGENLTWSLEGSTLVIEGSGEMYNWARYYDVPWYSYSPSNIAHVSLPDGLTSIGDYAFCNCRVLTEINIPGSVTRIGESAFNGPSGLISVQIPEGVTEIGKNAFYYCNNLTTITIPTTLDSIGEAAFYSCDKLETVYITDIAKWCGIKFVSPTSNPTSYTHNLYIDSTLVKDLIIPDGVTSIGEHAFYNCKNITSISIPEGLESIGREAFGCCTNLKSVMIPTTLKKAGYFVFSECENLDSVYITDLAAWCRIEFGSSASNPVYYANKLYLNNVQLTDVVVPSNITNIKDWTFEGFSSMTNITIPSSVKNIGQYAFYGCTGLTSISIPTSIDSIGPGAFEMCENLNSVHISDIEAWCRIRFKYKTSNPLMYAQKLYCNEEIVTHLTIPASITDISNYAFFNCLQLNTIEISQGVKTVGNSAFENCTDLSSVKIANSVEKIGENAFKGCNSLPIIDNIRYADTYLVEATDKSLTTYNIKKDIKWIGEDAFYYCSNLEEIIIPDNVVNIGDFAFSQCGNVKTLILPNNLKTIGRAAFYDCDGLSSLNIPKSVEFMRTSAFASCNSLKEIKCKAENPPILETDLTQRDVFRDVDKSIPLYVPAGSIALYQAADKWNDFTNIQALAEDEPTALKQISADPLNKATKILRIGQIFILRGDKTYTLQGQELK